MRLSGDEWVLRLGELGTIYLNIPNLNLWHQIREQFYVNQRFFNPMIADITLTIHLDRS
jgi:hypothetical protein